MSLRITIFYNQANAGFTETWYANGDEPPTVLTPGVQSILKRAVAFRAPLTYVYAIRFAVEGKPRTSMVFKLNNTFKGTKYTLDQENLPDVVSTCAQYRLRDAFFSFRFLELRGITDTAVLRDDATGVPNPQAGFLKQVDAYLNLVYNAGWKIKYSVKPSPGGLSQVNVISMQPNPLNEQQTELLVASDLSTQTANLRSVKFFGVNKNDLPGFPSPVQIISKTAVAPWKIVIPYRMRQTAIYTPLNMRVMPALYDYSSIADWSFWNFVRRDTGRPIGSLRGRARAEIRRV